MEERNCAAAIAGVQRLEEGLAWTFYIYLPRLPRTHHRNGLDAELRAGLNCPIEYQCILLV